MGLDAQYGHREVGLLARFFRQQGKTEGRHKGNTHK
jgi:hypothetical protein